MDHTAAFQAFWAVYPKRVARLAAMKAYAKALRLASAEQILAGVERYTQSKPDWQQWAYPASWLNAGRWLDEPDAQPVPRRQAAQHVGPGPSPRDLELIAAYERAKGGQR